MDDAAARYIKHIDAGTTCHVVAVDEAMPYVAGFTFLNDVSAHDHVSLILQASARDTQWALIEMSMGKRFPILAPVSPAVVTIDEVTDPAAIHLTTTVNARRMYDATISKGVGAASHTVRAA